MSGRTKDGIKYIYLNDSNDFKKLSLNDNLHFTLRDIWWNFNSTNIWRQSDHYNSILTNNISFEERTDNFQYTNMLQQKDDLIKVLTWLEYFTQERFYFIKDEYDYVKDDIESYMKFDDWWKQFEELKQALREQYEKIL
jgi:hypothetical protein